MVQYTQDITSVEVQVCEVTGWNSMAYVWTSGRNKKRLNVFSRLRSQKINLKRPLSSIKFSSIFMETVNIAVVNIRRSLYRFLIYPGIKWSSKSQRATVVSPFNGSFNIFSRYSAP